MNRRAFLSALGLLAAAPAAEAQPQGKIARVGITVSTDVHYSAFLQGLREAGWVPGRSSWSSVAPLVASGASTSPWSRTSSPPRSTSSWPAAR